MYFLGHQSKKYSISPFVNPSENNTKTSFSIKPQNVSSPLKAHVKTDIASHEISSNGSKLPS